MLETILECQGGTDELLSVSPDGTMKCANLVYLGDDPMDPDSEVFHISVTSCAMNGEHEVFDRLIGKQIKVIVQLLKEEE